MVSMTDHELLQAYATKGSQAAFTELVNRHLPLVWSAARRQMRDEHLTQDVAQQVFTLLASKAPELTTDIIVPGWLYRTTSHVAARVQRGESRRREREQFASTAMNEPPTDPAWMEVEPLLDEAMASLNDADRDAVILRYFENQSLREVGAALGSSEDAAQKRLTRAVEKLNAFFAHRGKTVTTAAFIAALAGSAIQPVPAGMAAIISATALSSVVLTATTATATATATLTTLQLMSAATLKPILITGAALAMSAVIVVQHNRTGQMRAQNDALQARIQQVETTSVAATEPPRPSPTTPANDPRETELLRLRGEVARLRAAEAELARLQELEQLRQADAQKQAATAAENKHRYDVQRIGAVDAFKHIGLQLRILVNRQKGADAFQADGTLKPDLIARTHPDFDLNKVEILVTDAQQLEELTEKTPDTIITRTRDPIPTPDGRFLRIYGLADGSAHQVSTEYPGQAFTGNWRLESIKPRAQ
jgi:RNA polymerase sigma factor (sigma-70 family)